MSNEQFTKIIDKIKKEDIKPLPKWKVDFKDYLYWFVLAFLILIGGLLISLTLIDYLDIGPELARNLKLRNFLFITFRTMPFLWIILLILSLVFGIAAFRSTKRGYRYSIVAVLTLLIVLVSVLGFISHISKMDQRIKNVFEDRPHLNKFSPPHEKRFFQPENGIIAGRIKELKENSFSLENPKGKWTVHYSEETIIKARDKKGEWLIHNLEEKEIKNENGMEVGKTILVIGEKIDEENFQAKVIIAGKPGKIKGFRAR